MTLGLFNARPRVALILFAVTFAGVAGFLGFLIAGSLTPHFATPLRALALVWFAVFGIWRVRLGARIR